ncbi:DDB1- and CUL4-associated factor 12 [Patella vulgata]|uniref:DDB1- and CUL4-associated factor 12 n=1 Tax=Patella vulgata TaxID=6465 RepID=UPI00217FBB83|nr:DDB1- and CUL4-associated factor 12 [Patella vulgata]
MKTGCNQRHYDEGDIFSTDRGITTQAFLYTQQRQYGIHKPNPKPLVADFASQQIPMVLKEREYTLGTINKIFASKWLNERQVVFGTKCNQLIALDLLNSQLTRIPTLKSSEDSIPADCPCGIHSVAVNPSRTLLATGASNTNDIAVYKLPTFDPVCVGENAHDDWIFDLVWVDDEFLISGSRDSRLALWKIDSAEDDKSSRMTNLFIPEYDIKKPLEICDVPKAQKVRALAYHVNRKELGILSLNAYFHLWDVETFQLINSRRLSHYKECVCMTVSEEKKLYAIGSQSHVTLLDPRSPVANPQTVPSKHRDRGIRSVCFNSDIISIGTGIGYMLFYDLRANKYLEHGCKHSLSLNVSKGWLRLDDNFRDFFIDQEYPNAIYTHSYDESGTRLFAAGGPLPAGLWGNYAGMWY